MMTLTATEKCAWLLDALTHCGIFLRDTDEETVVYHLFEEFDTDCISCFCEDNLAELEAAGLITSAVHVHVTELAQRFRAMESTLLWSPQAVRTAPEWLAIMELADRIRVEVERRSVWRTDT